MESNRKTSPRKLTNVLTAMQLIDILNFRFRPVFKDQINGHLEDELDQLKKEFEYYTKHSFFLPPRASKIFNKLLQFIPKTTLKNTTIRKHLITIRNTIINFWTQRQINRYRKSKNLKTNFKKAHDILTK